MYNYLFREKKASALTLTEHSDIIAMLHDVIQHCNVPAELKFDLSESVVKLKGVQKTNFDHFYK